MEVASSAPVSKLAVECKILLSCGCKCSVKLFEVERKGKKIDRYETRH